MNCAQSILFDLTTLWEKFLFVLCHSRDFNIPEETGCRPQSYLIHYQIKSEIFFQIASWCRSIKTASFGHLTPQINPNPITTPIALHSYWFCVWTYHIGLFVPHSHPEGTSFLINNWSDTACPLEESFIDILLFFHMSFIAERGQHAEGHLEKPKFLKS